MRNPRGRPKGSRHKLSEEFLAALLDSFREHGRTALGKFADQDPVGYVKFCAEHMLKDYQTCSCEGMCEKDFNDLTRAIIEGIRADRNAREAKAAGGVQH